MAEFNLVLDGDHRVSGFEYRHPDRAGVEPVKLGYQINFMKGDGSDRVHFQGQRFKLTEDSAVIHEDIEVPETVVLGQGAFVGRYSTFHLPAPHDKNPKNKITVGEFARIEGTKIFDGVEIGPYALVLAQTIGRNSMIGERAKLLANVAVYEGVTVGEGATVQDTSVLESGATVEEGSTVRPHTYVRAGVTIERGLKVGSRTGQGTKDNNKGVLIISEDVKRRSRESAS